MLFDQTIADLGIEKGAEFYHCTSPAHRRYVRSELEYYVAANKLVQIANKRFDEKAGREVREACHDNDDYSNAVVNEDGDAAAMQRGEGTPMPFIRKDGKWFFSIPDLEQMVTAEQLQVDRLFREALADHINSVIELVEAGNLKTLDEILQKLRQELGN